MGLETTPSYERVDREPSFSDKKKHIMERLSKNMHNNKNRLTSEKGKGGREDQGQNIIDPYELKVEVTNGKHGDKTYTRTYTEKQILKGDGNFRPLKTIKRYYSTPSTENPSGRHTFSEENFTNSRGVKTTWNYLPIGVSNTRNHEIFINLMYKRFHLASNGSQSSNEDNKEKKIKLPPKNKPKKQEKELPKRNNGSLKYGIDDQNQSGGNYNQNQGGGKNSNLEGNQDNNNSSGEKNGGNNLNSGGKRIRGGADGPGNARFPKLEDLESQLNLDLNNLP